MPKIKYDKDRKFTRQTEEVIALANGILLDYEKQGFTLTLRQLYYQFVARDIFPDERRWVLKDRKWVKSVDGTKNAEPNYDWLGEIMSAARMAGLVDWHHLIDRTRNLRNLSHYEDAEDALRRIAACYHIDMWENQEFRPEVWVEKEALEGIVERVCWEFDVPFFSCRGYTSQSAMWEAGQRLLRHHQNGYTTHIIHLGDHDPSGVDMSRDILDRFAGFMGGTEFTRIALTMEQVRKYNPPPNPAKITDSRCAAYIKAYGEESWELDALEPITITDLIRNEINGFIDKGRWERDLVRKGDVKTKLEKIAPRWDGVCDWLSQQELGGDMLVGGGI